MKSTFSIFLLIITTLSFAQTKDSLAVRKDPLQVYDVKLGFNIISAGRTWIGSGTETQEVQMTLHTSKYDLVFDYGSDNNVRRASYLYESNGTYFRAGLDKNFVKDGKSGNVLSLGLRYASASFDDFLEYTDDFGFGTQAIQLSNSSLKSNWFEITFNLRGKIVSNLYTGFTLRWKFARNLQGEGDLKTFDIPGFGNTKRQNATAFDYYLMWRIPFVNKK